MGNPRAAAQLTQQRLGSGRIGVGEINDAKIRPRNGIGLRAGHSNLRQGPLQGCGPVTVACVGADETHRKYQREMNEREVGPDGDGKTKEHPC